jgi:glycosyltransferase involved in cell wall biosynthesis
MMHRLRTLIVHPTLAPYRVDLFNALAERVDLEVVFQREEISYHRALDQEVLRQSLRCRFSYIQGNVVLLNRDFPAGIPALIRDRKPQVVVTSEFSLASWLALQCKRWSREFAHVIWTDESPQMLRSHNAIRSWLRRTCTRGVDAMLMCSDEVATGFSQRFGVPRDRIRRVSVHQSPAVIRSRAESAGAAARDLIERYGLERRRVLLFVGRLAAVKNLPLAITAFAEGARKVSNAVFVVVGDGLERDVLAKLVGQLKIEDRVIFAGHCEGERLIAWYRIAGCLVLPSTYEPYGAVVNEALICGVPVLCSAVAGAAHLVGIGGNGAAFDPANADVLGELFQQWLERAPTAGEAGRGLRRDLMPVAFEEDIGNFLEAIEAAATTAGLWKSDRKGEVAE